MNNRLGALRELLHQRGILSMPEIARELGVRHFSDEVNGIAGVATGEWINLGTSLDRGMNNLENPINMALDHNSARVQERGGETIYYYLQSDEEHLEKEGRIGKEKPERTESLLDTAELEGFGTRDKFDLFRRR